MSELEGLCSQMAAAIYGMVTAPDYALKAIVASWAVKDIPGALTGRNLGGSMLIPPDYRCSVCGATGVKLWRESYTFVRKHGLRCAGCSAAGQGENISTMRPDGKHLIDLGWTDQIGWSVPAVPTPDGSFWGYTSVPQDGVDWWTNLPNS